MCYNRLNNLNCVKSTLVTYLGDFQSTPLNGTQVNQSSLSLEQNHIKSINSQSTQKCSCILIKLGIIIFIRLFQVSLKKLKKFEKDYSAINHETEQVESPIQKLERESKQLREENSWLHQENDKLAKELVDSKIKLRLEMDLLEDKLDKRSKDLG